MKANEARYWDDLMQLAQITDQDRPYTRRSFSPLYLQGREWLKEKMTALGLEVYVDVAGNLVGKRVGKNPALKSIVIGSHSDTVPSGGRFDGIAGVISGLECIASLNERGIQLAHTIEIVDFLAEEPSEWGVSCVGSRGISGFMTEDIQSMTHPDTNETLASAINRMGGDVSQLVKREDVAAFFELHIEQGPSLEDKGLSVGIVTGIVGIVRLEINFRGRASHAGTTSMNLRKDTLTAAANTMVQASQLATQMDNESSAYLVSTCGQIFTHPNASNVVPGHTRLVFDIRSDDKPTLEKYVQALEEIAHQAANEARVEVMGIDRLTDTIPMLCDPQLMDMLKAGCEEEKAAYQIMPSGAGHDAAFLSHIAPSAMIFVPSKEGKSHCPAEWTSASDLALGTSILISAIEQFDQTATNNNKISNESTTEGVNTNV